MSNNQTSLLIQRDENIDLLRGFAMMYTFGALSCFYLCSKYILKGLRYLQRDHLFHWIFKQYELNCYTIFLYHPFSFLLILYVRNFFAPFDYLFQLHDFTSFVLYLFFTVIISAFCGNLFSWAERIKIIKQ